MADKSENQITTLTKISIVVNILLFGVTGIVFIFKQSYFIAIVLLLAGGTNIFSLFYSFNKKNMVFMAINFVFAMVSFLVFLHYFMHDKEFRALLWIAVFIYYLITAIILLIRIRKGQGEGNPTL